MEQNIAFCSAEFSELSLPIVPCPRGEHTTPFPPSSKCYHVLFVPKDAQFSETYAKRIDPVTKEDAECAE